MSTAVSPRTYPAPIIKEITAGALPLNPRPRALYIGVNGTIDIENEDGTTEAGVPVFAGAEMRIQPYKITDITDATVYGLYG